MNPLKSALALGVLAASLGATAWGADTTLGTKIDDSVLTARVKAALIANPDTKARQIDVDTNNGVVTLRGTVDNELSKTAAESTTKSIAGVSTVQNELMLKDSVGATAEATIPSSSTTVVPSASTSASSGTSPSASTGSSTTTTHSNSTDTVVASAGSPADSSASSGAHMAGGVDSSVMQALKSDPRTSGLNVAVTSGSGAVILSGTVSSATERNAAADVARSVSGVGRIDNRIVVSKTSKAD